MGERKEVKMKIALNGNTLTIADADPVQFSIIKSWNLMKWDKQNKWLRGMASLELLEKLSSITTLPTGGGISPKTGKPYPNIAERYEKLKAARTAVGRERVNETPEPMYKPPVKASLYSHQVRGYNMALLTFGWVQPKTAQ